MASKQRKRKHSRKEQSIRDKARILMSDTTYAEPLREYTSFLDHLKGNGYARDEFTRIPLNLIDLAAAIFTSMISGRELSLFGGQMYQTSDTDNQQYQEDKGLYTTTMDDESDAFYFIQRILKRTQLSCTTLVLALIYIDRFKARLARVMKRRTKLDQGPDYDHSSNSNTFPAMIEISREDREVVMSSVTSSCSSSTATSPSSSTSILTPQSIGSSNSTDASVGTNSGNDSGNSNSTKQKQESWSSVSLFLVSVICADKYLFDATFSNAEWADFSRGRYTTSELNTLERRFLGHLQYKLYVSEPEFDGFLSYLEVILALKQVWGRGLITFSYSDVRILTQRLMPAYADRLHFKALQGDMIAIVWQVMATFSRVYLTIVGAILVACAGYTAIMELSRLAKLSALSHPLDWPYNPLLTLPSLDIATFHQPRSYADESSFGSTLSLSSETERCSHNDRRSNDDDIHRSVMDWFLSQPAAAQYIT
ncbi:Cyclin-dependent protein kinase [Lobosporangium transversale]|uniref:Cyclin-domain-containing protein n=1 Tax=Lobosporangium transversale TaxID=64571 RepID=A0A1Y2GQD7_9FUNG|nr:hypothetical protein BCR41DRAFT_421306 [Lobosporangium transversale]KAF9916705.1 Cyclin-dependent protein kinase [Lobosporangium transversale]ORZ19107.1 hypothetical protein BCR41DRAFT_421306 [Lobosporangium transversale]|eukprot:XP_021882275.1 hypothetical protein BCR41DRAFT_421306 [Lobosporangium transversale]